MPRSPGRLDLTVINASCGPTSTTAPYGVAHYPTPSASAARAPRHPDPRHRAWSSPTSGRPRPSWPSSRRPLATHAAVRRVMRRPRWTARPVVHVLARTCRAAAPHIGACGSFACPVLQAFGLFDLPSTAVMTGGGPGTRPSCWPSWRTTRCSTNLSFGPGASAAATHTALLVLLGCLATLRLRRSDRKATQMRNRNVQPAGAGTLNGVSTPRWLPCCSSSFRCTG